MADLPNDSLQSMLAGLLELLSHLQISESECDRLDTLINQLPLADEVEVLSAEIAALRKEIETMTKQTKQAVTAIEALLLQSANDIQDSRQNDAMKLQYQTLLHEIETWLHSISERVSSELVLQSEEVQKQIDEHQCMLNELKLKEAFLCEQAECNDYKQHPDVNQAFQKELKGTNKLLNDQLVIVQTRLETLNKYLVQVREDERTKTPEVIEREVTIISSPRDPESLPSHNDNTLDSSPMPEIVIEPDSDIKESTPVIADQHKPEVHEMETQTGYSLQDPVIPGKDMEVQTSITSDKLPATIVTETAVQTIQESPTIENIRIVQTISEGHETIQIGSKPLQRLHAPNDDILVEAKYVTQELEGLGRKSSEINITHNVPQSFETVFVEPDETRTEVTVDPDGTKRIIVKKLRRTVLSKQRALPEARLSRIGDMTDDQIPISQLKPGSLSAVQEYNIEPLTPVNYDDPSDMYVHDDSMHEEDPAYDNFLLQEGEFNSSCNVRRIVRITKKIIRPIIDGKELIAEEVMEEPVEVKISADEEILVSDNVYDTADGQDVQNEKIHNLDAVDQTPSDTNAGSTTSAVVNEDGHLNPQIANVIITSDENIMDAVRLDHSVDAQQIIIETPIRQQLIVAALANSAEAEVVLGLTADTSNNVTDCQPRESDIEITEECAPTESSTQKITEEHAVVESVQPLSRRETILSMAQPMESVETAEISAEMSNNLVPPTESNTQNITEEHAVVESIQPLSGRETISSMAQPIESVETAEISAEMSNNLVPPTESSTQKITEEHAVVESVQPLSTRETILSMAQPIESVETADISVEMSNNLFPPTESSIQKITEEHAVVESLPSVSRTGTILSESQSLETVEAQAMTPDISNNITDCQPREFDIQIGEVNKLVESVSPLSGTLIILNKTRPIEDVEGHRITSDTYNDAADYQSRESDIQITEEILPEILVSEDLIKTNDESTETGRELQMTLKEELRSGIPQNFSSIQEVTDEIIQGEHRNISLIEEVSNEMLLPAESQNISLLHEISETLLQEELQDIRSIQEVSDQILVLENPKNIRPIHEVPNELLLQGDSSVYLQKVLLEDPQITILTQEVYHEILLLEDHQNITSIEGVCNEILLPKNKNKNKNIGVFQDVSHEILAEDPQKMTEGPQNNVQVSCKILLPEESQNLSLMQNVSTDISLAKESQNNSIIQEKSQELLLAEDPQNIDLTQEVFGEVLLPDESQNIALVQAVNDISLPKEFPKTSLIQEIPHEILLPGEAQNIILIQSVSHEIILSEEPQNMNLIPEVSHIELLADEPYNIFQTLPKVEPTDYAGFDNILDEKEVSEISPLNNQMRSERDNDLREPSIETYNAALEESDVNLETEARNLRKDDEFDQEPDTGQLFDEQHELSRKSFTVVMLKSDIDASKGRLSLTMKQDGSDKSKVNFSIVQEYDTVPEDITVQEPFSKTIALSPITVAVRPISTQYEENLLSSDNTDIEKERVSSHDDTIVSEDITLSDNKKDISVEEDGAKTTDEVYVETSLAESIEIPIAYSKESSDSPKPTLESPAPVFEIPSQDESLDIITQDTGYDAERTALSNEDDTEIKKNRRKTKRKQKIKVKHDDETDMPSSSDEVPFVESPEIDSNGEIVARAKYDGVAKHGTTKISKKKKGRRKNKDDEIDVLKSETLHLTPNEEQMMEIEGDESYDTISEAHEPSPVKVVEDAVESWLDSHSTTELTSRLVLTVPVLEAVITGEVSLQTSPITSEVTSPVGKSIVDLLETASQTSHSLDLHPVTVDNVSQTNLTQTAEYSQQTTPEPELDVNEQYVQVIQSEVVPVIEETSQTSPEPSLPCENQVDNESQTVLEETHPVAVQTSFEKVEVASIESFVQTMDVITQEQVSQTSPDITEMEERKVQEVDAPIIERTDASIQTTPILVNDMEDTSISTSTDETLEVLVTASITIPTNVHRDNIAIDICNEEGKHITGDYDDGNIVIQINNDKEKPTPNVTSDPETDSGTEAFKSQSEIIVNSAVTDEIAEMSSTQTNNEKYPLLTTLEPDADTTMNCCQTNTDSTVVIPKTPLMLPFSCLSDSKDEASSNTLMSVDTTPASQSLMERKIRSASLSTGVTKINKKTKSKKSNHESEPKSSNYRRQSRGKRAAELHYSMSSESKLSYSENNRKYEPPEQSKTKIEIKKKIQVKMQLQNK